MRIKQWVVLCIVLGSVHGILFAANYQDISELGTSAGMIGIGNVGGFSRSAEGLLENPVGLSEAGNSVSSFYTNLFADIDYITGAVSYQITPEITLGMGGVVEVNANNDITSTNNANEVVSNGSFTAYTAQYIAGVDIRLASKLNLGVTWTQYARKQSGLEGSGGDVGVGLRYGMYWGELLLYSKNILGQKVVYNNGAKEDLLSETGVSVKSMPLADFQDMEIFGQIKNIPQLNVVLKGVGLRFYPMNNPFLGVSLGYKDKYQSNAVTRGSVSAGVNLNIGALQFDYAYDRTDVYQQENQHYFSMSVHFPVVHGVGGASPPGHSNMTVAAKPVVKPVVEKSVVASPSVVSISAPKAASQPSRIPEAVSMPLAITAPISVSKPEPVVVSMPEVPKAASPEIKVQIRRIPSEAKSQPVVTRPPAKEATPELVADVLSEDTAPMIWPKLAGIKMSEHVNPWSRWVDKARSLGAQALYVLRTVWGRLF